MRIGKKELTPEGPEFAVVAEVGNNHNGSVTTAVQMIEAAAECGVQAVKFQTRTIDVCYTPEMLARPYVNDYSEGPTYGDHRRRLELPQRAYPRLMDVARGCGVELFSTPFDLTALEFLDSLGVRLFKVASGLVGDVPLLRAMAKIGKPVILSTGGCTPGDVARAVIELGSCDVAILQCTAAYPCEASDLNLRVIQSYREVFANAVIGLSDHYHTIVPGPPAYALGARIFEKHFTLNRAWKGTDHAFSLEPVGLRKYCRDLERTAAALGSPIKSPLEVERGSLVKMGKAIVAARGLEEGQELTSGDIEAKSPAEGMPAWKWDRAVGKRVLRPYKRDEPLSSGDLE